MFPFHKAKNQQAPAEKIFQDGVFYHADGDFSRAAESFTAAAESQHPGACTMLAFMYGVGQHFAIDEEKEAHYYQLAADHGDPLAQALLAYIYFHGEHCIIEKDSMTASFYLGKALEQDCREAAGIGLMTGLCGFTKDLAQAAEHFQSMLSEGEEDHIKILLFDVLMQLIASDPDPAAIGYLQQLTDDLLRREITNGLTLQGSLLLASGNEEEIARGIESLQQAAAKNDADAMFLLGQYFREQEKNEEAEELLKKAASFRRGGAVIHLALKEYRKNAESAASFEETFQARKKFIKELEKAGKYGDEEAFALMGHALQEEDPEKAAACYFKASLQQHNEALNGLGTMFRSGFSNVERSPEIAIACFKEATIRGNSKAHVSLGEAYLVGDGVPKDVFAGLGHLFAAAMKGEGRGMFLYGKLLYEGTFDGIRDEEEGMKWIKKAVELKEPQAMVFYWEYSLKSAGELNDEEVEKLDALLLEAAELGEEDALLYAGLKYLNGLNAEVDPERAMHYFISSGEKGNMEAVYWAGFMHLHGIGRKADAEYAANCFRKAAEGGNAKAQYEFGKICYGEKDFINSFQLFRDACNGGHSQAAEMLAQMFEQGSGVPVSPENAAFYRERAKELKKLEELSAEEN